MRTHSIIKIVLIGVAVILPLLIFAQGEPLITPRPASIRMQPGSIKLTRHVLILVKDSIYPGDGGMAFFRSELKRLYNIESSQHKAVGLHRSSTPIVIDFVSARKDESYELEINKSSIRLRGNARGIFYGLQTLLQLFTSPKEAHPTSWELPLARIIDSARFSYRGMHLDVSRHFFPVEAVKRYIDQLAAHKFNNFHWHLTDDQGWRIEIKKYPQLTVKGSCRDQTLVGRFGSDVYDGKKYCGYYTQDQVKEIVQYAASKYINVIPEIEMPGHSLAALSSYPYLGCTKGPYKVMETWGVAMDVMCAGNDSTYAFLENVLQEVMELFPSQYIHVGGDECPKERWKNCSVCQLRIKTEHLKDEHELQSYFTQRIEKFVNSKGRRIIGWDEILEGGLAPNATVMSWRGIKGGIAAAKMRHPVIMSPESPLYLNHMQSMNEDSVTQGGFNPLEAVYAYDPIPAALDQHGAEYILGGQGNVWTEYISNEKKLQYMLFPRMTALSEALWTPVNRKDWKLFQQNLPLIFAGYKFKGLNFSNAYYDLQPSVVPLAGNQVGWKLETRISNGHILWVRDSTTNASFPYTGPIPIKATGTYGAALADSNHRITSNWVWQDFSLNKATGKPVQLTTAPNQSYKGMGSFTLVDGVQNTKGMLKSSQFLGFLGNDLEAVIDLGAIMSFNSIRLHAFEQTPSWIYRTREVRFSVSRDGITYSLPITLAKGRGVKNLLFEVIQPFKARYVKVIAINFGIIPPGQPGAGTKAWLFADEIEIH